MKRAIILAPKVNGQELSPEQKKFLSWQKKTDFLLEQIAEFHKAEAIFGEVYLKKILPEMDKMEKCRTGWIEDVAALLRQHNMAKNKRKLIVDLMLGYIENLLVKGKFIYLEEIYNEFSKIKWKEIKELYHGDADNLSDEEEEFSDEEEEMTEEEEAHFKEFEEFMKSYFDRIGLGEESAHKQQRPKTAAGEKRKKTEELKMIKSLREIYLELVKEFHPDKVEGEEEKKKRTEIMQGITCAYEAKDLLELLRLQMELLHIDEDKLSQTPKEKLKLYNKAMGERFVTLAEEYEIMKIRAFNKYPNLRVHFTNVENAEATAKIILKEIVIIKNEMVYHHYLYLQKTSHKDFINLLLMEAKETGD